MEKANETGIYQLGNGKWGYRFVIKVDGETISARKTTDEFGKKLNTKKQAIPDAVFVDPQHTVEDICASD